MDRGEFAERLLIGIDAPVTASNIEAVLAWMEGENTRADNNPLATTLSSYDSEGATYFNTFGDQGQYHVRNYTTPEQGLDATISTLNLSYYSDIKNALQSGTDAAELEKLVADSPWGTKNFGSVSSTSSNIVLGTASQDRVMTSTVDSINQNPIYQYNVGDSNTTTVTVADPINQNPIWRYNQQDIGGSQELITINGVEATRAEWEALAALSDEEREVLRQMQDAQPVVDEPQTEPVNPELSPEDLFRMQQEAYQQQRLADELLRQEDAFAIARSMLDDMGLGSLYDKVYDLIVSGRSAESAMAQMRFEPEFKARFRGMEERIANGYNAITPGRYLELEDNYRNMLEQAGFPGDFIQDFHEFIANDVNETEFGDRIQVAMRAAEAADPVILEELKTRYGIGIDSKADITMYFLDPERAVTLLEAKTQLGVAELSAATTKAVGGRLTETTGRELFQRGYVSREVAERLKGQGSLRQRMVGEGATGSRTGPLTSSSLAAAEFGLDSEAVARLKLLRQKRQQRGVLESGAAINASGVSGFSIAQ